MLIVLVGCSNQTKEQINNEEPIQENITPTKEEISLECNNLCENDRLTYCKEEITLTLDSGTIIKGDCRVFAKYISGFSKCEGFCKIFGKEKGCTTMFGEKDPNCDGK